MTQSRSSSGLRLSSLSDKNLVQSRHSDRKSAAGHSSAMQTTSEEQEEKDMADFEKLNRKTHRNFFCYQFKSIRCTLVATMLGTIILWMAISLAWALVFVQQVNTFSDQLVSTTFDELQQALKHETTSLMISADTATADRSLIAANNTFDVMFPKTVDLYTVAKRHFDKLIFMLYSPNLEGFLLLTNLYGSRELFVSDGIIKEGRFQTYLMLGNTLGPMLSERGTSLPSNPGLNVTLQHPKYFQKVFTYGCSYASKSCGAVVLGYRSAFIDNGTLKHMVDISYSVSFMSTLLSSISHKSARAFIIQKDDQRLVAISDLSKLEETDPDKYRMIEFIGTTDYAVLRKAHEYSDEVISGITTKLRTDYGTDLSGLETGGRTGSTSFSFQSLKVDVAVVSLMGDRKNTPGILDDFVLVHMIDREVFTGTSTTLSIILGTITGVLVIVSLVMMLCISLCIQVPLKRLIRQMEQAKVLKFDTINTNKFAYFSELRDIQGSFYFLTASLKQYRSFLPAALLQTIEARLQMKQESKSKSGSNKIRPDLSTPRDENASHASSEVRSEGSLMSQSQATSDSSNSMFQQFSIGAVRRSVTVVEVHVIGLSDILGKTALQDFTRMHSKLVETIMQVVHTTDGATFDTFEADRFQISLNATISCKSMHEKQGVILAMRLKERLRMCNVSFANDGLITMPLLVCCTSGTAMVSLLGSTKMKIQAMQGMPLNVNKAIRDSTVVRLFNEKEKEMAFAEGNVIVLIDQATKDRIPKSGIEYKQVNVLFVKNQEKTQRIQICELCHMAASEDKQQEWLYTMRDDQVQEQRRMAFKMSNDAWTNFLRGNVQDAIDNAEDAIQHGSKDSHVYEKLLADTARSILSKYNGDVDQYESALLNRDGGEESGWQNTNDLFWKSLLQNRDGREEESDSSDES